MSSVRSRLLIGVTAVVGLGLLLAACGDDDGGESGGDAATSTTAGGDGCGSDICMEGIAFVPTDVTGAAGDTLTWTNLDGSPHTVTAGTPEAPAPEAFDSGDIGQGETYRLQLPDAGEFPFYCTIHPQMQGTILVE